MHYPLIVYKDNSGDYVAIYPDFQGCKSKAETLDKLLANSQEAIEKWMFGEPIEQFPEPSTPEAVLSLPEAQGRTVFFVDIDTTFLNDSTQSVKISLSSDALDQIDKEASSRGMSRTAFLLKAAQAFSTYMGKYNI